MKRKQKYPPKPETIERLRRLKTLGIPLMPDQIEKLKTAAQQMDFIQEEH